MRTISLALFVASTMTSLYVSAKCRTDAVVISRSTGFGISFGGNEFKGESQGSLMANIPVSGSGGEGCFVQTSKLTYSVESKSNKFSGKMQVYPIKGDFSNVENGSLNTYVRTHVMRDERGNPQVQVGLLSTVCAGNQTLSVESFGGSLENHIASHEKSVQFHSIIAKGEAARLIHERTVRGKGVVIPRLFADLFVNVTVEDNSSSQALVTPNVLVGETMKAGPISAYKQFTTVNLDRALCSPTVQAILEPYRIEKLEGRNDFIEQDYSRWRERATISWKVEVP